MSEASSAEPGPKRLNRSPSYPAIPLDQAIRRARTVWEHEKRNPAPVASIQEHWGYTAGTGKANLAVAALKKFGLLTDQGSGERRLAQLTTLALHIILADEDPAPLIRQAALTPPIHQELWNRYEGSLPSDISLRRYLILERNFTETGANDFIRQFRKTIAFARLDEPIDIAAESEPDEELTTLPSGYDQPERRSDPVTTQPSVPTVVPAPAVAGSATYAIPLVGAPPVHVTGPFPLSEQAWDHFIRVLEAMKPALIESPAPEK